MSKMTMAFVCFLEMNLLAGTMTTMIATNSIVLHCPEDIGQDEAEDIRSDFQRCLAPLGNTVRLASSSNYPTNSLGLIDLWQPYGLSCLNAQGPEFPDVGTLSNGIFTIHIDNAFASNHAHRVGVVRNYSNEIAEAYAFLESLAPSNLLAMTTDELLSNDLWKEVPPGQHSIPANELDSVILDSRSRKYFSPPLFAFHVWEQGPTNAPPYLWCEVPFCDSDNQICTDSMIYFRDRWWFSEWYIHTGEQQW